MKTNFDEFLSFATHERYPFFQLAANYYSGAGNVLDIGAGVGEFADLLKCPQIHLVDGNPLTVNLLRTRFENVHQISLPSPLPFPSGFFSLIHTSHLVEHLHPHELYELLKEADRCLAPGGNLIISTPLMWEGFYDDLSHIRPYPPAVFVRYLCEPRDEIELQKTRAVVANGYKVEKIVYRHKAKKCSYLSASFNQLWLKRLMFNISHWLQSVEFSAYERTGFTLVLRKPDQP